MQELKDKEHKEELAWKERKRKQAEHRLFAVRLCIWHFISTPRSSNMVSNF